jgi:amino acid transporter
VLQGTATALRNGGPIGLLLGYMTVGTICYSVMVGLDILIFFIYLILCRFQISLGEMIAYLPMPGYCAKFQHPDIFLTCSAAAILN